MHDTVVLDPRGARVQVVMPGTVVEYNPNTQVCLVVFDSGKEFSFTEIDMLEVFRSASLEDGEPVVRRVENKHYRIEAQQV